MTRMLQYVFKNTLESPQAGGNLDRQIRKRWFTLHRVAYVAAPIGPRRESGRVCPPTDGAGASSRPSRLEDGRCSSSSCRVFMSAILRDRVIELHGSAGVSGCQRICVSVRCSGLPIDPRTEDQALHKAATVISVDSWSGTTATEMMLIKTVESRGRGKESWGGEGDVRGADDAERCGPRTTNMRAYITSSRNETLHACPRHDGRYPTTLAQGLASDTQAFDSYQRRAQRICTSRDKAQSMVLAQAESEVAVAGMMPCLEVDANDRHHWVDVHVLIRPCLFVLQRVLNDLPRRPWRPAPRANWTLSQPLI